jgi:hypothetical protein
MGAISGTTGRAFETFVRCSQWRKKKSRNSNEIKKEGVKAGIPDIFFPLKTEVFNGLAIEFKKPKTGRKTKEQSEFMNLLKKYGWCAVVCTDAEEAIRLVKDYLGAVLVRMTYIPLAT